MEVVPDKTRKKAVYYQEQRNREKRDMWRRGRQLIPHRGVQVEDGLSNNVPRICSVQKKEYECVTRAQTVSIENFQGIETWMPNVLLPGWRKGKLSR